MLKFSFSFLRYVSHYFDVLFYRLYTLLISLVYNCMLQSNLLSIACFNIWDTSLFSFQSLTLVLTSPKAAFQCSIALGPLV